ncbi:hypothetical protein Tco_0290347 [Tanacetum coccineum]
MQAARDRQKSYADLKRKPIKFQVGDKVMLKVLPWKWVVHFGKWGKLNLRFVGPFKVLGKVGEKCYAKEPLAVPLDGLQFDDKLQFVEEPIKIVDREVKRLKEIRIPLIKVRWNSKRGLEFMWEREDQFKKKYPHLFTKTAPSSSAASSGLKDSSRLITITWLPSLRDFRGIRDRRKYRTDLKCQFGSVDIRTTNKTNHNLWDVIVNGDLEEESAPTGETSAPPAPKTAKQVAAKRNQERVKSILFLAIPDEYLFKFHNAADAKSL